jgi:hypothetical protein
LRICSSLPVQHSPNAQRTEIDPRHDGFRRTEHHVGQLRRDHGATPAIGEARPQRVQRGVRVVVVDAHVRAVEHLHVLAVDAARRDSEFLEEFPALFRQPIEETDFVLAAAEVLQHRVGQVARDLRFVPVAGLDAPFPRQGEELCSVADLVATGLTGGK